MKTRRSPKQKQKGRKKQKNKFLCNTTRRSTHMKRSIFKKFVKKCWISSIQETLLTRSLLAPPRVKVCCNLNWLETPLQNNGYPLSNSLEFTICCWLWSRNLFAKTSYISNDSSNTIAANSIIHTHINSHSPCTLRGIHVNGEDLHSGRIPSCKRYWADWNSRRKGSVHLSSSTKCPCWDSWTTRCFLVQIAQVRTAKSSKSDLFNVIFIHKQISRVFSPSAFLSSA